jgi:hypothetical protein
MMQCGIPDSAVITRRVTGTIRPDADGQPSPNDGKQADIRWYEYGIASGITYYLDAYVDGKSVLRKSATGRNVAKWRAAFDDMAEIIEVAE